MRITDFTYLAQNLRECFSSIRDWKEITISNESKIGLKTLFTSIEKLGNYTGIIMTGVGNLTIFPYQYFLISVLIKPLAYVMRDYIDLYQQLSEDCGSRNINLAKVIVELSRGDTSTDTDSFNYLISQTSYKHENINLLMRFLTDENYRLRAKSIANFNNNQYKLRAIDDFFGSFFLQIINVPNASSDILGGIIVRLLENPILYDRLSNELRSSLPFLIREKQLNRFVYYCMLSLKSDDRLQLFLDLMVPNDDPKFYSVISGERKLISIFWAFDHPATDLELQQAGELRCFPDPLFVNENSYYYLSTQWANTGNSRLDFINFKEIFNELYNSNFFVQNDGTNYELIPQKNNMLNTSLPNFAISQIVSIKTKPFIILAGLSGTGKSRLVRTLAYKCNNIDSDRENGIHPPSNFQLIKVKPNWHDSSELLGYESRISGKDRFVTTDFIRFIVKAWQHPETPFFLCLDEMNLAPVEQYFAEYLSAVETRRMYDGKIRSDALISSALIRKYAENADGVDKAYDLWAELELTDSDIQEDLKQKGISLPENLIVMGTVNMDETTHSFSRKVLDRAMTMEMNDIDLVNIGLSSDSDDWDYPAAPITYKMIIPEKTQGSEVYKELGDRGEAILDYLVMINDHLEVSPFKIAYRVRDEFLLYAYNFSLLEERPDNWLTVVLDEMTLMKILPRIEGDEERTRLLDNLITIFQELDLKKSEHKAKEMIERRKISHYTSFWI